MKRGLICLFPNLKYSIIAFLSPNAEAFLRGKPDPFLLLKSFRLGKFFLIGHRVGGGVRYSRNLGKKSKLLTDIAKHFLGAPPPNPENFPRSPPPEPEIRKVTGLAEVQVCGGGVKILFRLGNPYVDDE